jgi:hypothetical protein
MPNTLTRFRVAVIATDGFEETELTLPVKALQAAGRLVTIVSLNARSTLGEVIGCLVLTGVGQGMFQTPNSRALMNAVPPEEQGEASGLLATGAWSARASASRSRGPSSPASAAPRRVGRSPRRRPEPSPLERSRRCSRPFSLGSKAR